VKKLCFHQILEKNELMKRDTRQQNSAYGKSVK